MPPLIKRSWSSGSDVSDGETDKTSPATHFLLSSLVPPGPRHMVWRSMVRGLEAGNP